MALRGRRLMITAGLLGYGVLIELLQGLTGYRFAEWADLLADGLGIALGVLAYVVLRPRVSHP
ncbi:VanZ like family protein [compost metagenome]